jgi:hypothetical protein
MDDARLAPQRGAALHAAALTKDLEAPLKRDMAICIYINTSHTHNGQLDVPLSNKCKSRRIREAAACLSCPDFLAEMEFVLSPPQKCISAPAKPNCISTASSRVLELFLLSSLHN